jgi:recombination protein RecT
MAVQNGLVRNSGSAQAPLTAYLQGDAVKKQINQVVGGKNGTRFISSIVSAYQATPALRECTNGSILNAALLGEALNLSPSPQLGQYYMVPFKNKKKGCTEATFQLGYRGLVQLAVRSGYYKKLNALAIKEGELVRYDPLEEEIEVNLIEDEYEREQAPTVGYYAMFEYENGFRKTMYWSKGKMMAHADQYSQAFSKKVYEQIQEGKIPESDMWKYSSFWYKDFDGMAIKTMLRQIISKWGVMSIDLQKASLSDGAVIRKDGSADYVETAEAEEEKVVAVQEAVEPPKAPEPQAQAPAQTAEEQLPGQMSFSDEDDLNKAFL